MDVARTEHNLPRIAFLGNQIQKLMQKADTQNELIHGYQQFASSDIAGSLLPDDDFTSSAELPPMATIESMIADPNKVICREIVCSCNFFVLLHIHAHHGHKNYVTCSCAKK